MKKLLEKFINWLFEPIEKSVANEEPEFLKEFWVYSGTKSCTTVYAKNEADAKATVLRYSNNEESVYAIFKRTSDIRNPDYQESF